MPHDEFAEIINRLDRIEKLLNGDDEPAKGIIVRLDRVEQKIATRDRYFWAVAAPSIATLVGILAKMLWG